MARCLYKPGSRYVGLSVKITTEEAKSLYRPGVQDSKVGNVQMSVRVCVVCEATVPQGASCVCESARVGGDARGNCGACVYTAMKSMRVVLDRDKRTVAGSQRGWVLPRK